MTAPPVPRRADRSTPRRERVHPTLQCPHYGACGGCSTLHVPPAVQLADAAARLADLLGEARPPTVEIAYDVPRQPAAGHRTRLLYPVRPDPRGRNRLRLGLYARGSHDLVVIRECPVQDPRLTRFGRRAAAILAGSGLAAYEETTHRGILRALSARLIPSTRELLIVLVTRGGILAAARPLAERLHAAAAESIVPGLPPPRPVGVVRNLNDARTNVLLGPRSVPLLGRDHLIDRQDGLEIRIGPTSFYQTHRDAGRILHGRVVRWAAPGAGDRVVDAYGGVGAIGLRLARRGARVTIVEAHPGACRDALHNAERNALEDIEVVQARFANYRPQRRPDVLVTDPPRAGLGVEGVRAALALGARRLVHVACSLEAMGRDVRALVAGGYALCRLRLLDLFPHTGRHEAIALLERRGRGEKPIVARP